MASSRGDASGAGGRSFDAVARRILWLAVLLGAVRFLGLDRWSLWLDEAYTFADARLGSGYLNPIGYDLFERFYELFPGRPGEERLRLPAAVLGWACIPLTAWALAAFVGPRASSAAALFVAVSPWHVYWSQNARFYTLAQVFGLLGCGLVFRGLLSGSISRMGAGILALALAAGTHPSATMLFGAVLATPLIARVVGVWPESGRSWQYRQPTEAKLHLAWTVLLVLSTALFLGGAFWVIEVWGLWRARQGTGNPSHFLLTTGYLVSPVLWVGFLVGARQALRPTARPEGILLGIIVAGFASAFFASCFVRVAAQYVFVFMPLVAAIAALPLAARPVGLSLRGRAGAAYLAVLAAPLALETGLYYTVRNGDRPHWREAYRYVFERRAPTDLVLGMQAPVGQYYWNPVTTDLRSWDRVVQLDRYRSRVPHDWLRYDRRMWFIVNHEQLYDWTDQQRRDMLQLLEEHCSLEATFEVPWTPRDLDLRVYLHEPGG